ncbi:hypothetical protein B0H14DRAFT_3491949 [Mycena olivaceomarginata]|nr:hypothetical protein B0H14DRAFT_3491949 [Mycena olivaceomarginata]
MAQTFHEAPSSASRLYTSAHRWTRAAPADTRRTGRMRYLKDVSRRFKNGSEKNTTAVKRIKKTAVKRVKKTAVKRVKKTAE